MSSTPSSSSIFMAQQEFLAHWQGHRGLTRRVINAFPDDKLFGFFGQWEGSAYQHFLYAMDNEVHHRGQGYVYLRALGIEPPPFWERD